MDATFLQARIDATKAAIVAYEDAQLAFAASNIQSYTIDTGQDRQTVNRADLATLDRTIESLMNRLATLQARLNGSSIQVRPIW